MLKAGVWVGMQRPFCVRGTAQLPCSGFFWLGPGNEARGPLQGVAQQGSQGSRSKQLGAHCCVALMCPAEASASDAAGRGWRVESSNQLTVHYVAPL